jgi:hypothetical protein
MSPLLLPLPLPHRLLALLDLPLHLEHNLYVLAYRLGPTSLQPLDVVCNRRAGKGPRRLADPVAEVAAVQSEPVLELEARHAGGEVGLGLEAGEVGGAWGRHFERGSIFWRGLCVVRWSFFRWVGCGAGEGVNGASGCYWLEVRCRTLE